MTIINDIISMLKNLSFVDYVLYFSVLALIILTTSLIYVMKNEDNEKDKSDEEVGSTMENEQKELNLKEIAEHIEESPKQMVDMTSYEKEQEQKAIISYDELLKESQNKQLNFEKEEVVDDLIHTKKINISNIMEEKEKQEKLEQTQKKDSPLFLYAREETFLKALKELNEVLN